MNTQIEMQAEEQARLAQANAQPGNPKVRKLTSKEIMENQFDAEKKAEDARLAAIVADDQRKAKEAVDKAAKERNNPYNVHVPSSPVIANVPVPMGTVDGLKPVPPYPYPFGYQIPVPANETPEQKAQREQQQKELDARKQV